MPPPPFSIRFGDFAFDAVTGELWRHGHTVPLQPQPSRLLALLLSKPGELIGREEIRAALWGRDTHVDFERSLNFCVAKLRSALGDDAAAPRYIETIPTRGYRLIAEVGDPEAREEKSAPGLTPSVPTRPQDVVTSAPPPSEERQSNAAEPQRGPVFVPAASRRKPSWTAAVFTVAAVAVIIALKVFVWPPIPVVVVVPFHNETGAPELDRVAKGVSDATVANLAGTNRLLVIGNVSGLKFSFRPPDMKAVGESLGAQYLVLGQLKRDAVQTRVVAHLIRVSDQTHVWANTYDRPTLDLPQQAAVASEIAHAVTLRVGKRR
jgi:TolB-like protein/DNA-binding winged helix-turn-helix (wHTH) protein